MWHWQVCRFQNRGDVVIAVHYFFLASCEMAIDKAYGGVVKDESHNDCSL